MTAIINTELDSSRRFAQVTWTGGGSVACNVLWLRDNCPSGRDKRSGFRTFSVGELDPNLELERAEATDAGACLEVSFSDGHVSHFDATWLHARLQPAAPLQLRTWRSSAALPRHQFEDTLQDEGHLSLLHDIAQWGAAVVSDVPLTVDGTEALAARFGHVRETDFGRLFDIMSEPDVWTMSQSTNAMDPHTDDPFRYNPSGASLLHCIDASPTGGGASTLVDGFEVAATIRREHPQAFELLTSVSVPFIRYRSDSVDQGDAVNMQAHAPVIRLDRDGDVCGIRFHERSMGSLDLDPDLTDRYYRALIVFTKLIRDREFQWTHRLQPGEALMFDNQRVLHGRTGFDGDPGRRHLRLCTVDRDQFHSKLRRLAEDLGRGGHDRKLPAGNLS